MPSQALVKPFLCCLLPPGQGLNQAVEDCWALGKALVGADSVRADELRAIQDFRQVRSERLKPIMAYTLVRRCEALLTLC